MEGLLGDNWGNSRDIDVVFPRSRIIDGRIII